MLQSGVAKTSSMANRRIPQLGVEALEDEPMEHKHKSYGGSVRNKDNLLFG